MRAIVLIILALSCGVAIADEPKPIAPAAAKPCKVLKTSAGQVLKDSKGHALRTCTVTADSKITVDSNIPVNGQYLAMQDGTPITTEDGKYILVEGVAKK